MRTRKEMWTEYNKRDMFDYHAGDIHRFKLINKYLSKGKTLDIGYANKPNPYIMNVTGVDIGTVQKPFNYDAVISADVSKGLPFKDKSFNNVIAGELIEHLENPSYFIRECWRVLKKDGVLVLTTPNPLEWISVIRFYLEAKFKPTDHISELSPNMIQAILKNNGFSVKDITGVYVTIPLLARISYVFRHIPTRFIDLSKITLYAAKRNDKLIPEQAQREGMEAHRC